MDKDMIIRLASAIGKTPSDTAHMLKNNQQLFAALSKMSNEDGERLLSVLGDQNAVKTILATPQAKKLLDAFSGKEKQ